MSPSSRRVAVVALLSLGACGGSSGSSPAAPECTVPADCGADPECQARTCIANACGLSFTAAGTPVSAQTAGDCKQDQCNGAGSVVSVAFDADAPASGGQCTSASCSGGVPVHSPVAANTPCSEGGGAFCDGAGSCVVTPAVAATSPADASTVDAPTPVALTFTVPMHLASLTGQTAFGACSGSIQLSSDGFASCVPFASAVPVMSGGDTVATLVPVPGLLVNRSYQLRVTTAAESADGVRLAAAFTSTFATQPIAASGSAVNESGSPLEADYCTVLPPLTMTVPTGGATPTVYAQIFEAGTTEALGASGTVTAQLGFGPPTENPEYEAGWTWVPASYGSQVDANDEYGASFTAPAPGDHRYAYRFSLDAGATWTYCDGNGAGASDAVTFDLGDLPVLTVTP